MPDKHYLSLIADACSLFAHAPAIKFAGLLEEHLRIHGWIIVRADQAPDAAMVESAE